MPFRCVIFDCDSTLAALEGIEVLSRAHRDEVRALTAAAMRGELPLEDVYARRLALARPTRAQIDALGAQYVAALVPDAAAVVDALHRCDVETRIVSGGLLPAVRVVARALGVRDDRVAAVPVHFTTGGEYAGFDAASPLARSGGKRELIASWTPSPPRPSMLVGDGMTDLEARPAVDTFVAYAGIIAREPVVSRADVVIHSRSLAPVLRLALGDTPPADPALAALYEKGSSLLHFNPTQRRPE